jgi:hypothetical protein
MTMVEALVVVNLVLVLWINQTTRRVRKLEERHGHRKPRELETRVERVRRKLLGTP